MPGGGACRTSITTATDRASLRRGFQQLIAIIRMSRGAITEGADERVVLQALKSLSFSVRFKVLASHASPLEVSAYKTMIIRYLDSVFRRAWPSCPL